MAKQLGDTGTKTKKGKKGDAPAGDDATRTAEIAGNVTSETLMQCAHEMAAIIEEGKAFAEKRRRVRKTIKARGVELGDLDEVMKMADWDRDEVRAKFDRRRKYAQWLGLPIGAQAELFADMTAEQKAAVEWEARGGTAYRSGKTAQVPEDCPEDLKLNYVRGFKKAKGEAVEAVADPGAGKVRKDPNTGAILAPKQTAEREADNLDPAFN